MRHVSRESRHSSSCFRRPLVDGDRDAQPFSPGFIDYLFLSFTNATAFSPTDTLPLSQRAKLLMMAEAMISLLTIAFVAARAVNILAYLGTNKAPARCARL